MYLVQNRCTWDTYNEIGNPLQDCFSLAENTKQNQKIKHIVTCSIAFDLLRSYKKQAKHLTVLRGSEQYRTQIRMLRTD